MVYGRKEGIIGKVVGIQIRWQGDTVYFGERFKGFADTDGGGSTGIIAVKHQNHTGYFFQYIKL